MLGRRLGCEQSRLRTGDRAATGLQHRHVVADQFFDHRQMVFVMGKLGVVAADHAGHAPQSARDNAVVQRPEAWAIFAAENVEDHLGRKTGNQPLPVLGDVDLRRVAVAEVLDSQANDLLGRLHCLGLVELDVRGSRELGLGTGGDYLGVEAVLQLGDRREDALYVDQQHVHDTGYDGQLLLQEVARNRHAVTHEDLVGRATDAGQVDTFGTGGLGFGKDFGVSRSGHDHVGERRLVAVDNDVHLVLFQHTQVHPRTERLRLAEEHVGDVRGDHRAAPAVGQGHPNRPHDQVLGIVVHADVRHVHAGDHLAVDAPGCGVEGGPVLLLLLGRACDVG